jgi:hypothetical protein
MLEVVNNELQILHRLPRAAVVYFLPRRTQPLFFASSSLIGLTRKWARVDLNYEVVRNWENTRMNFDRGSDVNPLHRLRDHSVLEGT